MKQATTGTVSSCLVWILAFVVISLCILPISFVGSMFTITSDFAVKQTGAIVCPDNTTPEVRSFATYGSGPSTTYVLECVDVNGDVVKEDPVGFSLDRHRHSRWVDTNGSTCICIRRACRRAGCRTGQSDEEANINY